MGVNSKQKVEYFESRARMYADVAQHARAASCYEYALTEAAALSAHMKARLHVGLARSLALRFKPDNLRAIEEYKQALPLADAISKGDIHQEIGLAYYRERMQESALEHFHLALAASDTTHPGDVYFHMAAVYRRLEQYDEGLKCYDKAYAHEYGAKRSVHDWEIDKALGYLHLRAHNLGYALEYYEKALDSGICDLPGNIHNDIGEILLKQGHQREAEARFRIAADDLNLDASGSGYLHLGEIYERENRLGKALLHYRKAMEKFELAKMTGLSSPMSAEAILKPLREKIGLLQQGQVRECYRVGAQCNLVLGEIEDDGVFVAMPFGSDLEREAFNSIYENGMKKAITDAGLKPIRADKIAHAKDSMCPICLSIQTSSFIVADLTGSNANVFYEAGFAHALQKRVILVVRSHKDIPFDLKGMNCIEYRDSKHLRQLLSRRLRELKNTAL